MRKHLLLFLIGLFFCFPIFVNAKDMVSITSAVEKGTSGYAEETKKPSYEGLDLSLFVSFVNVNDSIRYRVTIQNDTNKDYILSDSNPFQNSDYVLYQYEFEDDSNVVKAKSEKVLFVTARYMKEVDAADFRDGVFIEKREMDISLKNEANTTNPNTGIPFLLIGITVLISFIGLLVAFSNRRYLKIKYGVFILGLLLLPFTTYALEVLKVHVTSNVEIVQFRKFCFHDLNTDVTEYYAYTPGTIMRDYLSEHPALSVTSFHYNEGKIDKELLNERLSTLTNGEYNDFSEFDENPNAYWEYIDTYVGEEVYYSLANIGGLYFDHYTSQFINNPILDQTIGCYQYDKPK